MKKSTVIGILQIILAILIFIGLAAVAAAMDTCDSGKITISAALHLIAAGFCTSGISAFLFLLLDKLNR